MGRDIAHAGKTMPAIDTVVLNNAQKRARLVAFQGQVDGEGLEAEFSVVYAGHQPLCVPLGLGEIEAVVAEMQAAAALMLQRRSRFGASPRDDALASCPRPLRPSSIEFTVDPLTQESRMVITFPDHAPIVLQLPAGELHKAMTKAALATFRAQQ